MTVLLGLAAATLLAQGVQANTINGSIDIIGSAQLDNNNLGLAKEVVSFGNNVQVNDFTQTGAFVGTDGDSVTMTPFAWNPSSTPVDPLWTFTQGAWTYSFDLASLTVVSQSSTFLNITGLGSLDITGTGSPYTPTDGQWTFTISRSKTSDNFNFGFDSTTSSVPDGGATVALLGSAMVGLSMLRRKIGA